MSKRKSHSNKHPSSSALQTAFRASLPVMAGYIVLGMGFGILLQSRGYAWWWALLMSTTIYAGSMQYVAVDLLSAGAGVLAAALMTLMVNVRHLFYGVSMLERYRGGRGRAYLIFALTDETFSLVCSPTLPDGVDERAYDLWVSALDQLYWVAGSAAGALIGALLPFDTTGIEFSMTALFVVIFVEQWEHERRHLPAVTGVVLSLACLLLFGASDFLIPAMIGITLALFIERRWLEGGDAR